MKVLLTGGRGMVGRAIGTTRGLRRIRSLLRPVPRWT